MMRTGKRINPKFIVSLLIIALLIATVLGLICGSVSILPRDVFAVLIGRDVESKNAIILWSVRFPRVLAGLLAGAGLGAAGVILQGVMNNSLASPNTIGVNAGAGFFVMLSMMLVPGYLIAKSLMAFLGALLTSILILLLAYFAEKSRITIILAGITISGFLSAGMNMIKIMDAEISINAIQFMIGSLSGITLKMLLYPAIGIGIGIILACIFSKALNLLLLGDGVAGSVGLRVNLFRFLFVILASILAGLVVSFAGLIGFVGLIVPHICRALFEHDARVLIPASSLMGAVLVLISDLLGRVLFAPFEIPIGIILSFVGGPFFLYLLMKKGGRRVNA